MIPDKQHILEIQTRVFERLRLLGYSPHEIQSICAYYCLTEIRRAHSRDIFTWWLNANPAVIRETAAESLRNSGVHYDAC